MKVYIQGEKKLLPLQAETTANDIEKALGYTPADEADMPDITNEDDSAKYVTDKDGNIITKTDSEGFHAAAIEVNGKDVESGLVTDGERETWNNKPDLESIDEADDSTLYVTDKDGNILAKIDSEGIKAAEVKVGESSVSEHIADYEANKAEFEKHKADSGIHASAEEKAQWSDKSFNSLTDSPISSEDTSTLYVVDSAGSIIAKIDKDGLHSIEVYIGDTTNGEQTVSTLIETAIAKLVGSAPETLDTLQELAEAIEAHQDVTDAINEAITKKANASDLAAHTGDAVIHITADERTSWNNKLDKSTFEAHKAEFETHKTDYATHKSNFEAHKTEFEEHKADSEAHIGMSGEIKLDDKECFYVTDKEGNILFKIDGDGADTSALKVGGTEVKHIVSADGGVFLFADGTEISIADGCSHTYEDIEEYVHTCMDWKVLQRCTKCERARVHQQAEGHTAGDWKTVTAATCEGTGTKRQSCTVCNTVLKEEAIAALGHNYVATVVAPSITAQGYTNHVCSRCSKSYKDNYTAQIAATITYKLSNVTAKTSYSSISVNDGTRSCTFTAADGYTLPSSVTVQGCSYIWDSATGMLALSNPTSNVTVTITGKAGLVYKYNNVLEGYYASAADTTLAGAITIPETYDGYPVIGISRYSDTSVNGFQGCTGITSVVIPSSVKYISEGVFYGCTNLKSATFTAPAKWRAIRDYDDDSTVDWNDFKTSDYTVAQLATMLTTTYVDCNWELQELLITSATIHYSITGGSVTSGTPTTLTAGSSVTVNVNADAGYNCPSVSNVKVTGATLSNYTRQAQTGALVGGSEYPSCSFALSDPTATDVYVTFTCYLQGGSTLL